MTKRPSNRSLPLPGVHSRVGIDPSPLDLANDEDRLWLEACLWPEEPRRMTRLEAIIAQRGSWPEVTVLRGTAAERLDDAIAVGDSSMLTIVLNSYVVAYFSEDEQTAFFDDMAERCANGNVAWISLESPFMVKFPTTSTESESARKGATEVLVTLPGLAPRHWGWCHHHGLWLDLHVPD